MITSLGTIKISLKFVDNQKPVISDLFSTGNLLIRYILGSLFYGLITFIPVLICAALILIPVLIPALAIRSNFLMAVSITIATLAEGFILITFMFWNYYLVDKDTKVWEAFKKSSEITKGIKIKLTGFFLLMALVILGGILALIIGLLVAYPVTLLAETYLYRKLSQRG